MASVTHRESKEHRHPSTKAAPGDKATERPQLKDWYEKHETHEQLAVGEKTSRTFAKTIGFLEGIEKKMNSTGGEGDNSGH